MRPRDIGNKTVLDDSTFDNGLKVRHLGWSVLWVLLGIAILGIGAGFLVHGTDFILYKTFAPRFENVRREVFENTKSYNQGMVMQVRNYKMSFETASPEHREALRQSIVHSTADYDVDKLPADLRVWIAQLRRGSIE